MIKKRINDAHPSTLPSNEDHGQGQYVSGASSPGIFDIFKKIYIYFFIIIFYSFNKFLKDFFDNYVL